MIEQSASGDHLPKNHHDCLSIEEDHIADPGIKNSAAKKQ